MPSGIASHTVNPPIFSSRMSCASASMIKSKGSISTVSLSDSSIAAMSQSPTLSLPLVPQSSALLAVVYAVECGARAEDQGFAGNGGGSHEAVREGVFGEDFELAAGLDD